MIILTVLPIFLLLRCRAIELPPTYKPSRVIVSPCKITVENMTVPAHGSDTLPRCGVANTPLTELRGSASIETYPWLGMLHYPVGNVRITTSVVLISRRLVIASALDIYKMPKNDFRKLARVVIGKNCTGRGYRVADYNYHPEFRRSSYSALVLIQLNLEDPLNMRELQPICGPPKKLVETRFYAMTLSEAMNIQRLGRCDPDEMSSLIFKDANIFNNTKKCLLKRNPMPRDVAIYNLTLFTTIDYTCLIIHASHPKTAEKPRIDLRSYSSLQKPIYQNPSQRIHFYVEIRFHQIVVFKVSAYGKERRLLEHKAVLKRSNQKKKKPPIPWDLKVNRKN